MSEIFSSHDLMKQQKINSSTRNNMVNNLIFRSVSERPLINKLKSHRSLAEEIKPQSPKEHKKDPNRFMPKKNYLKKDLLLDILLHKVPKSTPDKKWKINSFFPNKKTVINNSVDYINLKDKDFRDSRSSFRSTFSVKFLEFQNRKNGSSFIDLPEIRRDNSENNVLLYLSKLIERNNRYNDFNPNLTGFNNGTKYPICYNN
jgi:hypothetical protein